MYFTYTLTVCDGMCVVDYVGCSLDIFLGLCHMGECFPRIVIYW